MFKPVAGVAPEPLTPTQVNAITGTVNRSSPGLNANCCLLYQGSYTWFQSALMASGLFFDELLNLDMLASAIQYAGIALLVSVPSLPITEQGMTLMKNVVANCCAQSQTIGFIAPSGVWQGTAIGSGNQSVQPGQALPNGFFVYSPPVSSLSQAQRSARIMPPISVALIEAQSGHSLSVTVDVQQ
jgi:hypothetical protein